MKMKDVIGCHTILLTPYLHSCREQGSVDLQIWEIPSDVFSFGCWKPPEDFHSQRGDEAEMVFVGKHSPDPGRLLKYQENLQQMV